MLHLDEERVTTTDLSASGDARAALFGPTARGEKRGFAVEALARRSKPGAAARGSLVNERCCCLYSPNTTSNNQCRVLWRLMHTLPTLALNKGVKHIDAGNVKASDITFGSPRMPVARWIRSWRRY